MDPVPFSWLDAEDLRRWRACERRFWLHRRQPQPAASARDGADRVVAGPGAAQALRASYPGVVTIPAPHDEAGWAAAIDATERLLIDVSQQDEGWALAGACLSSDDGLRVCIDLVTRGAHGLRLFRRRHATAGTEADVDTVAAWLHVAARNGLRVQSAGLLLVDTGFVYPGHGLYAGLYREVDLAPVLGTRPVPQWIVAMRRAAREALPAAPVGAPCGGCEQAGPCALPVADTPCADATTSLEIVGRELAATLRAEGHASLLDVPPGRLAQPRHRRAARAVQAGRAVIERGAAEALHTIDGPPRWLRFETIGFAIPPWSGTQPYQVLPFQWSCDAGTPTGSIAHSSFLAGPEGDPRRGFAEALLRELGDAGPLYAYNAGFERNRIRELAQRFDDLAPALDALLPRIVDLFMVLRDHAYHPAMAGSWSAKSVFRAFVPEAGAHEFRCALRGRPLASPLDAYAACLQRGLAPPDVAALREALRAHGRRHCEALRRLTLLLAAR